MNPIALLAELLAYGFTVELRGGVHTFVGDVDALPPSLRLDLEVHHAAIERTLIAPREQTHAR